MKTCPLARPLARYSGARVLEEKRAPGAAPAATMLLADAVRKMRDRFALKATEVLRCRDVPVADSVSHPVRGIPLHGKVE